MGISIKNDEIEAMLRLFAAEEGVTLTEAIKIAIGRARLSRGAGPASPQAYAQLLERVRAKGYVSECRATRDEMHER